jgi:hypothetical protein
MITCIKAKDGLNEKERPKTRQTTSWPPLFDGGQLSADLSGLISVL